MNSHQIGSFIAKKTADKELQLEKANNKKIFEMNQTAKVAAKKKAIAKKVTRKPAEKF